MVRGVALIQGGLPAGGATRGGREPVVRWRGELLAGGILLLWSAVAALVVAARPGTNAIDRWGFQQFPFSPGDTLYLHVVDLGRLWLLIAAAAVAALVCVGRDRWRAAAVLAGPAITAVAVELILKPLVGRRLEGVLSYPSGNAAVLAAVATGWVLAVPRIIRIPVAVVAAVVVVAMAVAVTGLRWHYPSDAAAGVVLGVGIVLTADGSAHAIGHWLRRRREEGIIPASPQS